MKTAVSPLRVITGTSVATGAGSVATAIPVAAGGNAPEQVLVTVTEDTYVLPGASTVTAAATTSVLVTPESGGVVFNVKGVTHIGHIRATTSGRIAINPVEA